MTAEELVRNVIIEVLCVDDFTLADSLQNDLGADSLDKIQMVVNFEEALDIDIPDSLVDGLKTVNDLVELVKTHGRFTQRGASGTGAGGQ